MLITPNKTDSPHDMTFWACMSLALMLSFSAAQALANNDLAALDRLLMRPDAVPKAAPAREPLRLWAQTSDSRQGQQYQAYLEKADAMTRKLFRFRDRMRQQQGDITLQQLGAFCHSLRMERNALRAQLAGDQMQFESYRLMDTAVSHLEDAWRTWRNVRQFRENARSDTLAVAADDEALRIKLQRAQEAIEALHAISQAREALQRDLNGDF